jgi:glycosyltransferase involved in cell wall biosynthesis
MRVLIPDPGLRHTRGHNYAHAWALADECRQRSIAVDILAHVDVSDEAIQRLHCRPIFRTFFYDGGPKRVPAPYSLGLYVVRARRYFEDLSAGLTGRAGRDDVVLLNNVDCGFLAGYARWLASLSADARPGSAIALRFAPDDGLARGRLPGVSRTIYERLLRRIRRLTDGRLLLGSDTTLVAQDFAKLLGCEISYLPLPLSLPAAEPRPTHSGGGHLVFLGNPRKERGVHLLPEALSAALEKLPDLSATIQVSKAGGVAGRRLAGTIERLRELAPRVELIERDLSESEFYQCFTDSDAVLLPYDPGNYAKRSSQVLAEAAGLARPVIVIRESFLQHEMASAGIAGVVCEHFSGPALAEAIVYFAEHRQELLEDSWRRCEGLRKLHSAAGFVDCLESLAAGKVAASAEPAADRSQAMAS